MKKVSYGLKISNACEQDWASMTENTIGRFCAQCSKQVLDFTNLSDTQIIKIIEQTSSGLCGRLSSYQLDRKLIGVKQPDRNLLFSKMFAGFLLISTSEKSFAEKHLVQTKIVLNENNIKPALIEEYNNLTKTSIIDTAKNVLHGKVFDKATKDFLPSVLVKIKNTNTFVNTDNQGKFNLFIPNDLLTEKIVLQIFDVGYEPVEVMIDKKDLPLNRNVQLTAAKAFLGEVVIIRNQK